MTGDDVGRTTMGRMAIALVTLTLVLAGACDDSSSGSSGGDSGTPGAPRPLGAACESDGDCASGDCLVGAASHMPALDDPVCTQGCSNDDDCAAANMVCGTGPGGIQQCTPHCEDTNGFACVDGRSVACSHVGTGKCAQCGCPDGLRCALDGEQCETLGDVGAACEADGGCTSGNCGQDGTCKVSIGDSCDATNCDLCLVHDDWSFCSRPCETQSDCAGSSCLKPPGHEEFSCRPVCGNMDDPICPETCQVADPTFYCACEICEVATLPDDGMDGGVDDVDAGL